MFSLLFPAWLQGCIPVIVTAHGDCRGIQRSVPQVALIKLSEKRKFDHSGGGVREGKFSESRLDDSISTL